MDTSTETTTDTTADSARIAGAGTVRWQYKVVNLGMFFAGDRLVRTLAQLGAEGWELITIYDKSSNWLANMEKGFALFKRPVPAGQTPVGPWAASMASGAASTVSARQVQELLDRAGIDAPGAADALAPHLDRTDGLCRCRVDGTDGVFALGETTAAVWQPGAGVQPLGIRDLEGYRVARDTIYLDTGGTELVLTPRAQVLSAFAGLFLDRGVPLQR